MIIGIDLGTSNSAAAVLRGGRPVIIPSAEGISLGGKAFPSYVAFTAAGDALIGESARRQAATNPEGTATAFKRKMGQREIIKLREKEFTPEQLSAFLLQKIKRDAEAFLGESVNQAVVTVPAYFNDNQRNATKDACKIAGLEVMRLVNEPTAASLAYGLDRAGEDLRIAVIDLGGGTLDVTIMEFGKGVFEVKSTSGDTQLGGTDMDRSIQEYLIQQLKRQTHTDISLDLKARARIIEAGELAKIELSTATSTHINLPFIGTQNGEPIHFEIDLNRTDIERIVEGTIERCRIPVEQALKDAGFKPNEIDRIVFVGGPTRMPVVRQFFEKIFDRKAEMGVDPMECVACGAAIQAGILTGAVGDIVLVDVTPLTLGIETLGGIATPIIKRNSPVPVKHSEIFTTAVDLQTSVTVSICQGERAMAADNIKLGQFNLEGIPVAPRGVPKIEVSFDIDSNGIINVTAKDLATQKAQSIQISGSSRLADSEKIRMTQEAEKYAETDKRRKDEIQQFNDADATCYQAEKTISEFSSKLTDDLKKRMQEAIVKTKDAINKKDLSMLKDKVEVLNKVLKEAGVVIYSQVPGAGIYAETKTPQDKSQNEKTADKNASQQKYRNSEDKKNTSKDRVVDAEFRERV